MILTVLAFFTTTITIILLFGTPIGMKLFNKPIYLFKPSTYRFTKDALYVMNKYGVYSEENNFHDHERKYLSKIDKCGSYDDVIPVLNDAIKLAGGEHSSVVELNEDFSSLSFNSALLTYPRILKNNDIITLILPKFVSSDSRDVEKYVNTSIRELEKFKDIENIIIDLRGNTGGNMMPMLGAISPFLKEGKIFEFISNKSNSNILLTNGQIKYGNLILDVPNYSNKSDIPIAILVDNQTASSAEVVLIALKGQDNVKTFGNKTAGYATGVSIFPIYGKYALSLAGVKIKGNDNIIYDESPIIPDFESNNPEQDAIEWITSIK